MADKPKRILVASTNQGKLAEISAMVGGDVQWVSLNDFKDITEIKEDGATFAENRLHFQRALLKKLIG